MRTFVVDLEDGPGDLSRATAAFARAGVPLIDFVGVGEGSGLGLRVSSRAVDAARLAIAEAHLAIEELDESPPPHVELAFDEGLLETGEDALVSA